MRLINLILMMSLLSCATKITPEGKSIQIATDGEKEKHCKTIDIISASDEFGWNATQKQENAMNEIRNKASDLGGNAIRIISSNFSGKSSAAIIQAEVLDCKFPKNQ